VDPLALLAAEPERAALLLDVDGVLAPIVERPEDAAVPEETRAELRRLAARYGLVAVVSGRPTRDAEDVVGVAGLRYVGEHGLELEPRAAEHARALHDFARSVSWPDMERKQHSVALHYRSAADVAAARQSLEAVAAKARGQGFRTRFGRMVLEILPPVAADKGTAVRGLLEESGLRRALYAGDDTTDLDAFAALDGLELAVRVAVASAEGPQPLRGRADVVVESPAGLLAVLRAL
jgi:trehalose 6-phosphate phosphatase